MTQVRRFLRSLGWPAGDRWRWTDVLRLICFIASLAVVGAVIYFEGVDSTWVHAIGFVTAITAIIRGKLNQRRSVRADT